MGVHAQQTRTPPGEQGAKEGKQKRLETETYCPLVGLSPGDLKIAHLLKVLPPFSGTKPETKPLGVHDARVTSGRGLDSTSLL